MGVGEPRVGSLGQRCEGKGWGGEDKLCNIFFYSSYTVSDSLKGLYTDGCSFTKNMQIHVTKR